MTANKKLPLWAALFSYVLGFLWITCQNGNPWNYASEPIPLLVFAALFFLWAFVFLKNKPHSPEHWFWMVCTVLIGIAIALDRLHAADAFGYLAMHGFAAYWVICYAGLLTENETSPFLPLDFLEAMVLAPFGGFFLRIICICESVINGLRRLLHPNGNLTRKNLLISAALIAAALPLFLLANSLLGQADAAFAKLTASFLSVFTFRYDVPLWVVNTLAHFMIGLPVGAYLFGLAGTCYRRESSRFRSDALKKHAEELRFAPMTALTIIFTAFCALYLLFFCVQYTYLAGAFFGKVPGRLTAAQYARQGFFQLCKVMCINFLLLALAAKLGRIGLRQHKTMRRLSAALMIESILLAVTAASKLLLYINRFGFTAMRLLSAWGILVLAAGCVLALVSLRRSCKAVQKWIWFCAATFTLLCFY